MNKKINALLDACVKKSLGTDPEKEAKFSIVECGRNEFLDPSYDAIEALKYELMLLTIGYKARLERGIEPE